MKIELDSGVTVKTCNLSDGRIILMLNTKGMHSVVTMERRNLVGITYLLSVDDAITDGVAFVPNEGYPFIELTKDDHKELLAALADETSDFLQDKDELERVRLARESDRKAQQAEQAETPAEPTHAPSPTPELEQPEKPAPPKTRKKK